MPGLTALTKFPIFGFASMYGEAVRFEFSEDDDEEENRRSDISLRMSGIMGSCFPQTFGNLCPCEISFRGYICGNWHTDIIFMSVPHRFVARPRCGLPRAVLNFVSRSADVIRITYTNRLRRLLAPHWRSSDTALVLFSTALSWPKWTSFFASDA